MKVRADLKPTNEKSGIQGIPTSCERTTIATNLFELKHYQTGKDIFRHVTPPLRHPLTNRLNPSRSILGIQKAEVV